jgi:hypothetical protein
MVEKYYSARLHTELVRRAIALEWLKTHPRPNRRKDSVAYWQWWRTYHFAHDDETWHKFVARTHKPRSKPQEKPSPSSGHPAYREPGHPLHAEYLDHARAYNARYR